MATIKQQEGGSIRVKTVGDVVMIRQVNDLILVSKENIGAVIAALQSFQNG